MGVDRSNWEWIPVGIRGMKQQQGYVLDQWIVVQETVRRTFPRHNHKLLG